MAIPTQATSGSEVLRRGSIDALSSTETAFRFDNTSPGGTGSGHQAYTVPANHIITMITITIAERGGVAENVHMWLENVTSPNNMIQLLQSESIGIYETFVWNDRFSLIGGDALKIRATSVANIDVWFSYIDQSWV